MGASRLPPRVHSQGLPDGHDALPLPTPLISRACMRGSFRRRRLQPPGVPPSEVLTAAETPHCTLQGGNNLPQKKSCHALFLSWIWFLMFKLTKRPPERRAHRPPARPPR